MMQVLTISFNQVIIYKNTCSVVLLKIIFMEDSWQMHFSENFLINIFTKQLRMNKYQCLNLLVRVYGHQVPGLINGL